MIFVLKYKESKNEFKNLVHLMTQAYEKESFFTFSLFKICIHELSLNFITACKELMRFININDLLVCFFFPLFQVFLFQTLSPSSASLPVTASSYLSVCLSACPPVFFCFCLYVCLHVFFCFCLSVCLSVCLCLYVCLSVSFSLSLSIYLFLSFPIYFLFFLSLSISVYN